MKQTAYLKCFMTQERVHSSQLHTEQWKRQQWHQRLMSRLWLTTYCQANCKNQQSYKISQWFNWSVYLAYQVFTFCQKSILSNRFATLVLTQNRLMRCSSSVVNPVAVAEFLLMSFLHDC